jgi:6-hydroxynicotinate 3-monooxygenase
MTTSGKPYIGIIGAGLGGAAAAALLQASGYHVDVYEQASSIVRLGAGIHLGPNCVKVLNRIGVGRKLLDIAVRPAAWVSRMWDTGDIIASLPLRDVAEARYGAAYVTMHRGDMHALLISAVAPGTIHFDKRLVDLDPCASSVVLKFEDCSKASANIVIGADGVHSRVREWMLGAERPVYSGYIGHRTIFPAERLGDLKIDDLAKWWAHDRHLIVYFLTNRRDEVYLVTGAMEDWPGDITWTYSNQDELRQAFKGFHPTCQRLIDLATGEVTKWAFFERPPQQAWSKGRIVLLGDACHPMKPHMAQGAAMAIEDAAMLVRCLDHHHHDDFEQAFALYRANRFERVTEIQRVSRHNTWLRDPYDPTWVFGYDVFSQPLVSPSTSDRRAPAGTDLSSDKRENRGRI